MYLRPSEIFYSQDSINNVFDKRCNHRYKPIGETLDEICDGRCPLENIPKISVVDINGKLITEDNRRLWVFKNLERLGKCEKIHVQRGYTILARKRTAYNGGVSVRVRGSPGGYWHLQPSVTKHSKTDKNADISVDIAYGVTNVFKKPDTNCPNVFSSNFESPEFCNHFSRGSSSHFVGSGYYVANGGANSDVNNTNAQHTSKFKGTSFYNNTDAMFQIASSATLRSPEASDKFETASSCGEEGFDDYDGNTYIWINEHKLLDEPTSNKDRSSETQAGIMSNICRSLLIQVDHLCRSQVQRLIQVYRMCRSQVQRLIQYDHLCHIKCKY
ncbi:uncharacterized protein LOC128557042 [Mercenaria mercenaria]|uniref:uncharacterized protein LOC128557042 n=1 Tax=Mercenaria mercenaria TaxID=6596 RepID=UPI00234E8956|nr:uncharacterized protein LOC128557042 [Mercenaria mercenaria]